MMEVKQISLKKYERIKARPDSEVRYSITYNTKSKFKLTEDKLVYDSNAKDIYEFRVSTYVFFRDYLYRASVGSKFATRMDSSNFVYRSLYMNSNPTLEEATLDVSFDVSLNIASDNFVI